MYSEQYNGRRCMEFVCRYHRLITITHSPVRRVGYHGQTPNGMNRVHLIRNLFGVISIILLDVIRRVLLERIGTIRDPWDDRGNRWSRGALDRFPEREVSRYSLFSELELWTWCFLLAWPTADDGRLPTDGPTDADFALSVPVKNYSE